MATLEILRTGPLAVVQDLGRPGLAHLGVSRSGAADRRAHQLANRLVANPTDRATVEVTFGGFAARVRGGDIDIAVTGADTDPTVNGNKFGTNSIQHVHDGQVIALGTPRAGLRTYLAVRGGIGVEPVLGSRSYDVMSAIGPAPLRVGDQLPVSEHTPDYPEVDQAPVAAPAGFASTGSARGRRSRRSTGRGSMIRSSARWSRATFRWREPGPPMRWAGWRAFSPAMMPPTSPVRRSSSTVG